MLFLVCLWWFSKWWTAKNSWLITEKQSTWPTIMSVTILVLDYNRFPRFPFWPCLCFCGSSNKTDAAKSASCSFQIALSCHCYYLSVSVFVWVIVIVLECECHFVGVCQFVGVVAKRARWSCSSWLAKGSDWWSIFMYIFLGLLLLLFFLHLIFEYLIIWIW